MNEVPRNDSRSTYQIAFFVVLIFVASSVKTTCAFALGANLGYFILCIHLVRHSEKQELWLDPTLACPCQTLLKLGRRVYHCHPTII